MSTPSDMANMAVRSIKGRLDSEYWWVPMKMTLVTVTSKKEALEKAIAMALDDFDLGYKRDGDAWIVTDIHRIEVNYG